MKRVNTWLYILFLLGVIIIIVRIKLPLLTEGYTNGVSRNTFKDLGGSSSKPILPNVKHPWWFYSTQMLDPDLMMKIIEKIQKNLKISDIDDIIYKKINRDPTIEDHSRVDIIIKKTLLIVNDYYINDPGIIYMYDRKVQHRENQKEINKIKKKIPKLHLIDYNINQIWEARFNPIKKYSCDLTLTDANDSKFNSLIIRIIASIKDNPKNNKNQKEKNIEEITLKQLQFVGTQSQDKHTLLPAFDNNDTSQANFAQTDRYRPIINDDSTIDRIIAEKNVPIDDYQCFPLEERGKNRPIHEQTTCGQTRRSDSISRARCEARYDDFGRSKNPGVWDRKCRTNAECPFYRGNRNYPNNRGGCQADGYCEMPLNVQRLGYRYYSTESRHAPFCHSCRGGIENRCCNEQKNSKLYPHLNGPDYAFSDDREPRFYARRLYLKPDKDKWNTTLPIETIIPSDYFGHTKRQIKPAVPITDYAWGNFR